METFTRVEEVVTNVEEEVVGGRRRGKSFEGDRISPRTFKMPQRGAQSYQL